MPAILPQSICIMRLSAIGDVCHAAALVTRITRAWPECKITWVIGKIEYELVKGMHHVEFIVCDKKHPQAKAKLKMALQGREFDVLLMMQVALRANWLSTVIKAKRRIGFDWARAKEGHWLFTNCRIAPKQHAHVLDGFMQFADAIGVPKQPLAWDIPIPEEDEQWAHEYAIALGTFVIVAPAASKAERNWTAQGYAQVMLRLIQQGITPVLCGGPGPVDAKITAEITALMATESSQSPKVTETSVTVESSKNEQENHVEWVNLVGITSLKQMLALMSHAQCVLAPDTGPAHMGTTVHTPVVGLYAHSNPLRTGPYLTIKHTVSVYEDAVEQQFNRPWQSLPWGTRVKGKDLMQKIDVEKVWAAITKILQF